MEPIHAIKLSTFGIGGGDNIHGGIAEAMGGCSDQCIYLPNASEMTNGRELYRGRFYRVVGWSNLSGRGQRFNGLGQA